MNRVPFIRMSPVFPLGAIALLFLVPAGLLPAASPEAPGAFAPPRHCAPPGKEHAVTNRAFTGIPSVAVAPQGRLWATWYAGVTPGEDLNNYAVLSTSDDGGATWREVLVVELVAELLVIDAEVIPTNALLGHAGGAAGFKNVEGLALVGGRHPDFGLEIAQPLVLKVWEISHDVLVAVHLATGVEVIFGPVEPEGAASF